MDPAADIIKMHGTCLLEPFSHLMNLLKMDPQSRVPKLPQQNDQGMSLKSQAGPGHFSAPESLDMGLRVRLLHGFLVIPPCT